MIAVIITPTNIVVSDTLDVMIHQCSLLSNTETHDTDLVDKSPRKVGQFDRHGGSPDLSKFPLLCEQKLAQRRN